MIAAVEQDELESDPEDVEGEMEDFIAPDDAELEYEPRSSDDTESDDSNDESGSDHGEYIKKVVYYYRDGSKRYGSGNKSVAVATGDAKADEAISATVEEKNLSGPGKELVVKKEKEDAECVVEADH